jgi:adenylate cyclase
VVCAVALAAAAEANGLAEAINRARHEAGHAAFAFGIALHVGDVIYGNIGGATRLDFTVIGPAVNLASRSPGYARRSVARCWFPRNLPLPPMTNSSVSALSI